MSLLKRMQQKQTSQLQSNSSNIEDNATDVIHTPQPAGQRRSAELPDSLLVPSHEPRRPSPLQVPRPQGLVHSPEQQSLPQQNSPQQWSIFEPNLISQSGAPRSPLLEQLNEMVVPSIDDIVAQIANPMDSFLQNINAKPEVARSEQSAQNPAAPAAPVASPVQQQREMQQQEAQQQQAQHFAQQPQVQQPSVLEKISIMQQLQQQPQQQQLPAAGTDVPVQAPQQDAKQSPEPEQQEHQASKIESGELEAQRDEIQRLKEQIAALNDQISDIGQRNTELESQLQIPLAKQLQNANVLLADAEKKNSKLSALLQESKLNIQQLATRYEQLKKLREKENNQNGKKIALLQRELEVKDNDLQLLSTEIISLKDVEKGAAEINQQNTSLVRQLEEMQQNMQRMCDEYVAMKQEIVSLKAKVAANTFSGGSTAQLLPRHGNVAGVQISKVRTPQQYPAAETVVQESLQPQEFDISRVLKSQKNRKSREQLME